MLRQPIMVFMGNVDAGKTQLLDKIRNTAIATKEAGGITQAIGASIIPLDTIRHICGSLLSPSFEIRIPGLLTIDTPGHAAFTNIRKRGGNLADIAVLVIDINDGVKPQTAECIEILKHYKTPFVVALNKLDILFGWKSKSSIYFLENLKKQSESAVTCIEKKLYEVVGKLSELGFNSERFDRVSDYTKEIAIVPTSAITGEGIPELLMVITGISQKFLDESLKIDEEGNAKGTIIEVKLDKGLGKTIDLVLYNGILRQNDIIVVGDLDNPVVTKVKALFEPLPLTEMRDKKAKFMQVKETRAAMGVKICASGIDNVVAGMPLRSCKENEIEKVSEEIKKEVEEVVLTTDNEGVVVKADSLGSLEAVVNLLKDNGIKIKRALIGPITKKDILDAEGSYEEYPLLSCVLGFNVGITSEAKEKPKAKIITSDIIYRLIDELKTWQEEEKKKLDAKELEFLIRPCKIQLIKEYVFRQSNPAIVGVEVLDGTLAIGMPLMKSDGIKITEAKGMQENKENINKAEKGKRIALSMPGITIGRNLGENDVLYSFIPEEHFRKLKKFKRLLSNEEIELLKQIAEIMRKDNPMWGV